MHPASARRRAAGWLLALTLPWAAAHAAAQPGDVARGEYLFRASGCAGCHTDSDHGGGFLAGGRALPTPFGTFYAPNITPDPGHGIGGWSAGQFVRAMRHGVAPDGSHYYPAFPYTSYTRMRRDDLLALKAYLDTVAPVAQENRRHELVWYLRLRPLMGIWKWLFFTPGEYEGDSTRSAQWNRGAYLARAMAHCGECHTPRRWYGALDGERALAGTAQGPEGKPVPNITPHESGGIGRWDVDDIAYYLRTGMTPGGDFAGGQMAEVIDNGLRHLSDDDRRAIAVYVKSVPPVASAARARDDAPSRRRDEFAY